MAEGIRIGLTGVTMKTVSIFKPLYICWMKLAYALSWFNSRLLLFLIFYFVFTPIGWILKLLRKDLLDMRIKRGEKSYWRKKDKNEFGTVSYEKQF
ncbi:MAG: SxtJ family membrane protein [Candidatus Omnitrophota bacterium]|jgi:hypothetical protein